MTTEDVKLLRRNLWACRRKLHKLQRFEVELKGVACFKIFQVTLYSILVSFKCQICLLSSALSLLFSCLLDKEFLKGHALHRIFNWNTVKISYCCILNLKQIIDGHNKSTLRKTNTIPPKACNCRQPAHCPLDCNCLKSAMIHQATVTMEDNRPAESYVGLTENSFKTRYENHKSSFRDPNKRLSTELCRHIWNLKDTKIEYNVTWKILKQAAPFNPPSNCCNLCPWKKYFIICRPDKVTLNKRNELVTSCRQAHKFLLSSFTSSVVTQ